MNTRSYNGGLYTLPNLYGHSEDTEIYFPEEKVYATVLNTGSVTFYDENRKELATIEIKPNTKNGMHDNAYCKAEQGKIILWFPIVDYIDNYPNCDGEYDRWDVRYIGYDCVAFDIASRSFERSVTENRG